MEPLIHLHWSARSLTCPARSFLTAAALLLAVLAGCTTTRFPEDPEDHRVFRELEAAGHEYYFNVRAGVSSRLMGMMPESDARAAMDEIRRRWPDIDRLDRANAITAYANANGLAEVGERIQTTLAQNQANAPPDGIDERLEAAAVKQGIIDAAFELEAE